MNRWDRLRWVATWAFQLAGAVCSISVLSTLVTVTIANAWIGGILASMTIFMVILWVKTAFLYLLGSGEAPHLGLRLNREFFQSLMAFFVLFYPLLVWLSLAGAAAAQFSRSIKTTTIANLIAVLLALGIPLLARPDVTAMPIIFPKTASVSSKQIQKMPLEIEAPEKLAYTLAFAIGLLQLAAFSKPLPKHAGGSPSSQPGLPPVPGSLKL